MARNHFPIWYQELSSFLPLFRLALFLGRQPPHTVVPPTPPPLSSSLLFFLFSWLPQKSTLLLQSQTLKHVYPFNLMKKEQILFLGWLSLSFIVGLILWILISFPMTLQKHRFLRTPNDNFLMILSAHRFMVLLVLLFLNRSSVLMIVLLMLGLALRTIFKTTKLPVFLTLSLNSMRFPLLISQMWKLIVMHLKILLLLLTILALLLSIIG